LNLSSFTLNKDSPKEKSDYFSSKESKYSKTFHKAEAPEIISHSSAVILACLNELNCKVSFSEISLAFLDAFSIAFILALISEAALFKKATQRFEVIYNSYNAGLLVFLSGLD